MQEGDRRAGGGMDGEVMRVMGVVAGALAAVMMTITVAAAQLPPMRAFGTVTVDGRPVAAGTVVEALVGSTSCGEGQVRRVSDEIPLGFVVDVRSAAQTPGCGNDGDRVTFKVGGVQAAETAEYATGTFLRVNLTVAGQTATPPPGPTPPPFSTATPAPATATAAPATATPSAGSPTPAASPTAGATATATSSPAASPSPAATGTPATSPTGTATAPVFTSTPAPAGGSGDGDGGGSGTAIAAVVAVALLAGAGAGGYLFYRSRRG